MLFSSLIFLYSFLPLTLLVYYLAPGPLRNYWLLLASLVFFAWGGVSYTLLLIISIVANYAFGLLIQKHRENDRKAYTWLSFGVGFNLLFLGVFKYTNFIIENLNLIFTGMSLPPITGVDILLPVGISFYTFHSLSYLVDIYRRKTNAQTNIFYLALYICMFSQLIAGPIIRYSDVWQQLTTRQHNKTMFATGIERFLIGLAKKVLLANSFASVADSIFRSEISELNALTSWLGIVCYSLQIYYDFAGYSDMAIGLGRMFGFDFKENFNLPYIATSVKEFWRRWHISLSSFFRDYVYIPLGGNQKGAKRTYLHLFLVFFLTGFWHGASWNFVVWGLFHGFFMIVERLGFEKILARVWKPFAHFYTLVVVMLAWVLFRANDLEQALSYWRAMFNFQLNPTQTSIFVANLKPELLVALFIGIIGAFGVFYPIERRLQVFFESDKMFAQSLQVTYSLVTVLWYAGILLLCTLYLSAGTYNPFIYYRF